MQWLQFRVLYRQFLFRIVDLEVLSAQALGDANRLLGQFAALLVFISVSLSIPALFLASGRGDALPGARSNCGDVGDAAFSDRHNHAGGGLVCGAELGFDFS